MQALLFESGSKGFSKTSDQDVLVDCLVSCLRLNPNDEKLTKICLAVNAPNHLKFSLIRALQCIATQVSENNLS